MLHNVLASSLKDSGLRLHISAHTTHWCWWKEAGTFALPLHLPVAMHKGCVTPERTGVGSLTWWTCNLVRKSACEKQWLHNKATVFNATELYTYLKMGWMVNCTLRVFYHKFFLKKKYVCRKCLCMNKEIRFSICRKNFNNAYNTFVIMMVSFSKDCSFFSWLGFWSKQDSTSILSRPRKMQLYKYALDEFMSQN